MTGSHRREREADPQTDTYRYSERQSRARKTDMAECVMVRCRLPRQTGRRGDRDGRELGERKRWMHRAFFPGWPEHVTPLQARAGYWGGSGTGQLFCNCGFTLRFSKYLNIDT